MEAVRCPQSSHVAMASGWRGVDGIRESATSFCPQTRLDPFSPFEYQDFCLGLIIHLQPPLKVLASNPIAASYPAHLDCTLYLSKLTSIHNGLVLGGHSLRPKRCRASYPPEFKCYASCEI